MFTMFTNNQAEDNVSHEFQSENEIQNLEAFIGDIEVISLLQELNSLRESVN